MESRPVRLGWLSLLLTVIILCLATLSVLSFSTARADLALAQKQARQAQSVYALECAGQQWLAELDAALAQAGVRRSWMRCCRMALPGKAPV